MWGKYKTKGNLQQGSKKSGDFKGEVQKYPGIYPSFTGNRATEVTERFAGEDLKDWVLKYKETPKNHPVFGSPSIHRIRDR